MRRWLSEAARLARKFQRLTPVEHVLKRPEVYLGPMDPIQRVMWLPSSGKGALMAPKKVTLIPALSKLFDEILVNAADNCQRKGGTTRIDVQLDPKSHISVENNGNTPPVAIHQTEKVYIPEMIFGTLMTGSNFDDAKDQARTTGGRHGFGAKLTNIMSREFRVCIHDGLRGKSYSQTWTNNMRNTSGASVTELDKTMPSKTKIEFDIDLSLFGVTTISNDNLRFMKRRVWDLAATLQGVDVYLNNKKLLVSSFAEYIKMHSLSTDVSPIATATVGDSTHVGLRLLNESERLGGVPSTVSYVNNVFTMRGGSHAATFSDQIARFVSKELARGDPKSSAPPTTLIKNRLLTFVSLDMNRPQFESQSKELLTNPVTELPKKLQVLSKPVITELVAKAGIVRAVQDLLKKRDEAQLRKAVGPSARRQVKKLNIPKLEDATLAGTADGHKCTLLLTEGDSAKALAMAGLSVVGRETYGVFPLRGKLLNVRDCSQKQLLANQEILSLLAIVGLKPAEDYSDPKKRKGLRYGRVMLMTDQDHDGSHIKGLAINIFDHLWPSLIRAENFLQSFITPIVKVFPKDGGSDGPASFFTLSEFQEWASSQIPSAKFRSKYYKGLGTSTSQEAREYFSQLDTHVVPFKWTGQADSDAIDLAFRRDRAEDRRDWLSNASFATESSGNSFGAASTVGLSFSDFVNKELILFSQYDNFRSIPSVIDGLKPSQRKVLYACFMKKLFTNEMKVGQLAGYVAEKTAYHHGEASLHATIVKMAQDFTGSNNLPLLDGIGQFGTRLQGGQDSASARYIFTKLKATTRHLFSEADDPVLDYELDDGEKIEPRYFVPVVPMILVNGTSGIGTGWKTEVPSYNPIAVIDNLERLLMGKEPHQMTPWTRYFRGSYERVSADEFLCRGCIEVVSSTRVRITELPTGTWTENYRKFLMSICGSQISDYIEFHTESTADFEVTLDADVLLELQNTKTLFNFFRLESKVRLKHMFLFDKENKIRQFTSPEEILEYYVPVRLKLYADRKAQALKALNVEIFNLHSRRRFLELVADQSFSLVGRPLNEVHSALERLGFEDYERSLDVEPNNRRKRFDYLLRIPLQDLTHESAAKLGARLAKQNSELKTLEAQSPENIWLMELRSLKMLLMDAGGWSEEHET